MAAPALLPGGKQLARHPHRGLEVDPERPPDLLLREAVEASRRRETGVRHQHVDVAGVLQQAKRRAVLGEVGDDRPVAFPGQGGHELVELLRLARAEDERGPAIGESDRHRPPEAAGGPGEQHRLALEPHPTNLPTPEPELRARSDGSETSPAAIFDGM